MRGHRSLYVKICMDFVHNARQISRWYNPNFTSELEENMKSLCDQFAETEILVVGFMNSRVGMKRFHDKSPQENSAQKKPIHEKSSHGKMLPEKNTHIEKFLHSQYYQFIHS